MIDRLPTLPVDLPYEALADYCRRWKITKLEVFGSVLREDFGPVSDMDFLVTFDPAARLSLFDLVHAQDELAAIVGRPVDLVERGSIEKSRNWIRRRSILESARTIYVS
ncbi:MAG: nucleotidyltransferase domain-containing protein [Planctomycetota bacterium]